MGPTVVRKIFRRAKKKPIPAYKKAPREPRQIFWPDHPMEIRAIAMRGLTDDDMAKFLGQSSKTIKDWKRVYPAFKDAIEQGRTMADAEVVASLHDRATGKCKIKHTEVVKLGKDDYELVNFDRHYPPDVDAAKYWLNNRSKEYWSSRTTNELSGPNGNPLEVQTRNELIDAIVKLVKPKKEENAG